jgi:hypothetical protein
VSFDSISIVFMLGVIIFGSVRFYQKIVTKPKFKKKPKPVQTDQFRFGSVRFGSVQFSFFRIKTGSNCFGSVFSVWLSFFRFGSVWFFQNFNRFNWFFFCSIFSVIFFCFLGLIGFLVFLPTPSWCLRIGFHCVTLLKLDF